MRKRLAKKLVRRKFDGREKHSGRKLVSLAKAEDVTMRKGRCFWCFRPMHPAQPCLEDMRP